MPDGIEQRKGREGSRWINQRPSAEEVAEWFKTAVKLPEGLNAEDYVNGVTLIQTTEKTKEVIGWNDNNTPRYMEVENVVYVPYVKVETRVQYFTDLMELKREEWEGFIEPVRADKPAPDLPPGFFKFVSGSGEGATPFIGCGMKVTVFKRGTVKWVTQTNRRTGEIERIREGETIIDAPPATKIIPTRKRSYADEMSMMKAETGAIGRAIGMAGMLIVPGTGVATAEDMHEAQTFREEPSTGREEAPPAEGERGLAIKEASQEELVERAATLIEDLKEKAPARHTALMTWINDRGFKGKLSEQEPAALKGIIKRTEGELGEADKEAKSTAKEAAKEAKAAAKAAEKA